MFITFTNLPVFLLCLFYFNHLYTKGDIIVMFNTFVSTVIMHYCKSKILEPFWASSIVQENLHVYLLIITFCVWMNAVLKLKVVVSSQNVIAGS